MTDNLDPLNPDNTNDSGVTFDPNKNYLEELVGEGKKFKDNQALAKGKAESDIFIKTLEREKKELLEDYTKLREEVNTRASLQDLVTQLAQVKAQSASNENPEDGLGNETRNEPVIKPEDIEKLVSNKLSELKQSEKRQTNLDTVRQALTKKFGSNYQTSQLANRIGVDEKTFIDMAANHPTVVIKSLGLEESRKDDSFSPPPPSSRSSASFVPETTDRTDKYYERMRREDPQKYHSREIQLQRHADAQRLGEGFFDAD